MLSTTLTLQILNNEVDICTPSSINVIEIFNVILIIVNVVIYIYHIYTTYRREDVRRVQEYKLDWLKSLDIAKRIENLSVYIEKYTTDVSQKLLLNTTDVNERKNIISPILIKCSSDINNERRIVNSYVKCISTDKCKKINKLYEAINDKVYTITHINVSLGDTTNEYNAIREYMDEVIKFFYELGNE